MIEIIFAFINKIHQILIQTSKVLFEKVSNWALLDKIRQNNKQKALNTKKTIAAS